jgi:hypothetical protein
MAPVSTFICALEKYWTISYVRLHQIFKSLKLLDDSIIYLKTKMLIHIEKNEQSPLLIMR